MNFADILKQTGAVESISRELGVDQATARNGVDALLPAILVFLTTSSYWQAVWGADPVPCMRGWCQD